MPFTFVLPSLILKCWAKVFLLGLILQGAESVVPIKNVVSIMSPPNPARSLI